MRECSKVLQTLKHVAFSSLPHSAFLWDADMIACSQEKLIRTHIREMVSM
jgi:hypothetical protein